jgi:large subunit ribosomal protein L4
VVVDELTFPSIKTREMAVVLKALQLTGTSCLVGTAGTDLNLYKSARNLPGVEVSPVSQFSAYSVLRQKKLLLTKAALEELRKGSPTKKEQPAPAV